jgi:hypothetical protein
MNLAASIAAAAPPAGGAPLGQVIGATAAGVALTLALATVGMRHRSGRSRLLNHLAWPFVALLRVPAWAALPAAIATGSLAIAGLGFYWDVAVHIDRGRDPGPFGTAAHFPILLGLFGLFAAGWLSLVMARGDEAARTGIRLTRDWTVPTSGLVMMLCGGFALAGFPLDDIWHSLFGQDVTLWGPTHLILLTGGQSMIVILLALLAEGRIAAQARRTARGERPHDPRVRPLGQIAVAVSGAGGVLAGLTVYQAEFGFGVPQYSLLFQPALLAFTGALALVMGRLLVGRGGALGATFFYLATSAVFAVTVGPILGYSTPHFATYLPAAACVEAAALLVGTKRPGRFVMLAGVLVGTLGTLGEWGWTHVWMPIPWPINFVGGAIGVGVVAGVCGALVGGFVAGALAPHRVVRPVRRGWVPGAVGMAGLAGVLAFCLPVQVPSHATATIVLDHDRGGPARTAQATVSFRPASVVRGAWIVQQLSWQGHARHIGAMLRPVGPGVFRTVEAMPLHGSWKTLIRLQAGRTMASVPVYMPADPAIPVAGIAALPHVTRALVSDVRLMQRERKTGVPGWLWVVATTTVLAIIAVLLVLIGWGLDRVAGRMQPAQPSPPVDRSRRSEARRLERAVA